MEQSRTVIVGMGNPTLRDDGVGVAVARALSERLAYRDDIEVIELYTGGIRLMEVMVGFSRAIVVDAMMTGTVPPGMVRRFQPEEFVTTKNTVSSHDTDFLTAVEMGRMLGFILPTEITVWGIEAQEVELFGEELTPAVAGAVPSVIDMILRNVTTGEA